MRKAIVTGGNRGIGLAIAKGLKAAGYSVTIGVRNLEEAQPIADQWHLDILPMDLSQIDSLAHLKDPLSEADILINNAGVLFEAPLFSQASAFDLTVDVMMKAPYHLMKMVLPGMKSRNFGRIVNVSSGWGAFSDGVEGPGAYGLAKAGLNGLTVAAARDVSGYDIQINSICPGWVATRMGGAAAPLSPEQGADTAIWLAMQEKGGPNGQFLRGRKVIAW